MKREMTAAATLEIIRLLNSAGVEPWLDGVYQMANGEEWIFPARGFNGSGTINDMVVRCLSAEIQVLCHAHGYVPTEKDLRDMELLRARFGVELPQILRRDGAGARGVSARSRIVTGTSLWLG